MTKHEAKGRTMKRPWKWVCALPMAMIVMINVPALGHASSAHDVIQTHVHEVLDILRNPADNRAEKEKKILAIAEEIFDYAELSRLALANYWKTFAPDQQKEFIHLFGKLIADDYMGRIMGYTDEKVTFSKVTILSENTTEVQTTIMAPGKTIAVAYRMIQEKETWKVYDVVVVGISLVLNYRSQFMEILANKPPEDLLRKLRQKVR